MSFGFSPGVAVKFLGSCNQVFNALRDDGSIAQYQVAQQQCRGFLSVMKTIKMLDISGLPEPLRKQIEEQTGNVQESVADFRMRIQRYEKSMGEYSERGAMKSSARKVQWAFDAADDLEKFRVVLAAQLDIVQLATQAATLAVVTTRRQNGHTALGLDLKQQVQRSQPLTLSGSLAAGLLVWHSDPARDSHMFDAADTIAQLICKRLLTRPGFPVSDQGKVYTLPDNHFVDGQQLFLEYTDVSSQNDPEDAPQGESHTTFVARGTAGSSRAQQIKTASDVDHRTLLIRDTNDYLKCLSMPGLTSEEASQIAQDGDESVPFLQREPPDAAAAATAYGPKPNARNPWRAFHLSDSFGVDPLSVTAAAAGVIALTPSRGQPVRYSFRLQRCAEGTA